MKKLLLLFCCLSLFTANAQNGYTTYTANLTLSGIVLKQSCILVDNSGNKWFGYTAATTTVNNVGLVKYDNTNWTLYNTTSVPALPSNQVTALAKDNSGNIWIGSHVGSNAALVKFDGTSFTTFDLGVNTALNCIEVVNNQIYVGTTAGLYRFDGTGFTNYNVASASLSSDLIYSIKAEKNNLLWLGSNNNLIEFSINNTFTATSYIDHLSPFTGGKINCIHIDAQNDKWLGTGNYVGVLKYSAGTFAKASDLYDIYGSVMAQNIYDISEGFHNGVVFKAQDVSGDPSMYNGLIELAPNAKVYQYLYPVNSTKLGGSIEKVGSDILVSATSYSTSNSSAKIFYKFNETSYHMPLGSVNITNFKTLDINNVKAGISNRSDMHWDIGGTQSAMYEVPKGSGKHSNFASALWIGGLDNGGQLHGGAQTYRQSGGAGGVNFWPGPLDTINATIDTATSLNYDKIWKVSYTDINNFITAFNSGSVVATPDMLTWPAHGSGNNSRNLAPFVDYNGDGLYNPNDGDYPKIKGDQTLYFIYNDKLAARTNTFSPMGIEVQGMAYAYGCPAVVNGRNELTYTTFYDYKIINRSSTNYHDVFVSMWSDVDLGYYGDDYIGSNVADNYGYAYNGDGFDETIAGTGGYGSYIPAQGFNIVKGPLANANDGIDNNNNGAIDEIGEDCKMNKFNYFNNSFPGVPWYTVDPENGQEYYNYMTGYWKDGTSLTCGGNGYGPATVGTITTNWVYPGDPTGTVSSDPANTCGNWIENATAGDRRMILSSGPFNLIAGQMQEVEYAFVTSFDSSGAGGAMSLGKLKTDIQKINTFYNLVNKPNCLQAINVGLTEVVKQNDFALFPNPAKSLITISSTINGTIKINYEIVDVLGKVVIQNENTGSDKFSIDINDLNSGIYFLRLQVNNSVVVKKFVKE